MGGGSGDEFSGESCIEVLRNTLRIGDIFCWESSRRLLIQLPAMDEDGAQLVKDRLRHGLEQAGFVFYDIRHMVIEGQRAQPGPRTVEQGSAS